MRASLAGSFLSVFELLRKDFNFTSYFNNQFILIFQHKVIIMNNLGSDVWWHGLIAHKPSNCWQFVSTGIIKLKNNGDFFIANEGRRPIYIDGRPVLSGNKWKLNNNSVVEVSAACLLGCRGRNVLNLTFLFCFADCRSSFCVSNKPGAHLSDQSWSC